MANIPNIVIANIIGLADFFLIWITFNMPYIIAIIIRLFAVVALYKLLIDRVAISSYVALRPLSLYN